MENRILRLSEVASTNTLLREMAACGAPHGQVLIAGTQSSGRGRSGRSFGSPKGGLYLSMLHRPEKPLASPGGLTACAAVAVCRAIEQVCGVTPGIKWVNDLMLGGKKICGILVEAVPTPGGFAYIIGVGVNVNTPSEDFPEELRSVAGSIFDHTGKSFDVDVLAYELIARLDDCLESDCLECYRSRCVTPGREVLVVQGQNSYTAFAESINDDYSLAIRHPDGRRENLSFGEVSTKV